MMQVLGHTMRDELRAYQLLLFPSNCMEVWNIRWMPTFEGYTIHEEHRRPRGMRGVFLEGAEVEF